MNLNLAIAIGSYFHIDTHSGLTAICTYIPSSKRSEFISKDSIDFVVDCYNANPTSMILSLESFITATKNPRGVVLGDMLELGTYAEIEHAKIVEYVLQQNLDQVIFIGNNFKKVLENTEGAYQWFENSGDARAWFSTQNFSRFTFLLKGSRGIKVEKILGM